MQREQKFLLGCRIGGEGLAVDDDGIFGSGAEQGEVPREVDGLFGNALEQRGEMETVEDGLLSIAKPDAKGFVYIVVALSLAANVSELEINLVDGFETGLNLMRSQRFVVDIDTFDKQLCSVIGFTEVEREAAEKAVAPGLVKACRVQPGQCLCAGRVIVAIEQRLEGCSIGMLRGRRLCESTRIAGRCNDA